jgi:hypothetical protein
VVQDNLLTPGLVVRLPDFKAQELEPNLTCALDEETSRGF